MTRARVPARARIAIFLAWVCVVAAVASRHEPWRDEVHPYSVATTTASLGEMFGALHTDGHPALWYLLLRGAHALAPVPAVLPIVAFLVAAAAVLLFLARSPFGPVVTVLFPFSVLPLYEYSVMARNYGVSLLGCFAFAALYRARRPALLAACLVLLANTNAHSAFLTVALAFVWAVDELQDGAKPRALRLRLALVPVAAAAAGLAFAAWSALPRESVVVHRGLPDVAGLWHGLLIPGGSRLLAPFSAPGIVDLAVFLLLAAGFAARPSRLLAAGGAVLGLYAFFVFVYPGDLRHVGLLLVLILTLLWMEEDRGTDSPSSGPVALALSRFAFGAVLPALLAAGVVTGAAKARTDLREDMSASRPAAAFIRSRPEFADAILTGEPDYALEPFPYYLPNRIYLPREGRFGLWALPTKENRDDLTLGQVLDAAGRLRRETGRRVLLLMNPVLVDPGPQNSWTHSFGKTFTRSPGDLERLAAQATLIGRFVDTRQIDERYVVFEMRDPPPPSGPSW